MSRRSLLLPTLVCLALVWTAPAQADLPADTTFDQRRDETLAQVAGRYDGRVDTYTNCFEIGAHTIGLVAQIDLGERGLAGGVTLADAQDDIEHLADEAIRVAGDSNAPCAWENAGSPGTMHAFLGLAMILHRHESELPTAIADKIKTAAQGYWRGDVAPYLVNANIAIVAGHLLAGEVMGYDSQVWRDGVSMFDDIYDLTTKHGGLEMNAPIYTAYQFAALIPLMELEHDQIRQKARILLDYLFLVHAHLYLPGGGIGAPQSRDYAGGARDELPTSLERIAGLYTGDSSYAPVQNIHLIGAAVDYRLPEAIRSIYLDKGDGYEFWAYTPAPVESRTGRGYPFGEDDYPVAPWQAVVTPDAMFGVNHGFRYQSIHVSMGVYARTAPDTFPVLYQYQPYLVGDTSETGGGLPSGGGDTEANDFVRELYDFRRHVYGRSLVSIWDPTLAYKDTDAVRQARETRVHIPDYSAYGGQMRTENTGGWFVGQAGESYVAYYPLGTVADGPERRSTIAGGGGRGTRDSEHYYIRLSGRSGGIVELATTDQFATIDDYVADLKQRHIAFSDGEPMYAEFDALDPDTGQKVRMRIEYKPEKRFVDGQELTHAEALDHGWLASPFLDYDAASRTMTLARGCYPQITYDLQAGTVTKEPASGPGCYAPSESTMFSDVPHYGDFANYTTHNDDRWSVVEDTEERRLFLAPYVFEKDEDRLNAVAVVDQRSFDDFHMVLEARTNERIADNDTADYAVVFGYQDESNYYFLLANARADYSELFVLEAGVRRHLGTASTGLIPDQEWHRVEVVREGDELRVTFDGQQVLAVTDSTYGAGAVGVGSLNDSALFDNIAVSVPGTDEPEGDAGSRPADAGGAGDTDNVGATGGGSMSGNAGCSCDTGSGGKSVSFSLLLALVALIAAPFGRRRRT